MTTFASPRLTRLTLTVAITLLWCIGLYILISGILHSINAVSKSARTEADTKANKSSHMNHHEVNEPRFPSTSAPSVELIFGIMQCICAIVGIVAVTQEKANLLATYSHILVISCFVKLLFLIASASMHSLTPNRPFLTNVTVLGGFSAIIELILVMCVCQFTKLIKRGDSCRQEIQSIHSFHMERRSRSRSQSRLRSFYTVSTERPNSYVSASQTPAQSLPVSRTGSFQDLSTVTESVSYYVPPPIFLKLDR